MTDLLRETVARAVWERIQELIGPPGLSAWDCQQIADAVLAALDLTATVPPVLSGRCLVDGCDYVYPEDEAAFAVAMVELHPRWAHHGVAA